MGWMDLDKCLGWDLKEVSEDAPLTPRATAAQSAAESPDNKGNGRIDWGEAIEGVNHWHYNKP